MIPPLEPPGGFDLQDVGGILYHTSTVPAENILGGPDMWNRGWEILAGEALEVEKLEISACALGFARACVDEAWRYAEEREQFEVPIGQHQSIRHALASAGQLLTH